MEDRKGEKYVGLKIGQWAMVNFPWVMIRGLHWNSPSEALMVEDRVGLKFFSASQWTMIRRYSLGRSK